MTMNFKKLFALFVAVAIVVPIVRADDAKPKVKPFTLKNCVVSGDKIGGDGMEPYVFTYKDRQIKMCCKGCRKDFDKDPAKYIKKIEEEEAKAKSKS